MRLSHRVSSALAGALLGAVVACGSGISEPKIQQVQSPLVGQWMLTTKIDTFSSEVGYSPPTCMQTYCTVYSTDVAGAYLAGMLQVRDTMGLKGITAESVQAAGTLTQCFCGSSGTQTTAGYVGDITGAPDGAGAKALTITIHVPNPTDSVTTLWVRMASTSATYAGDSIYGRFVWGYPGRSPPTYRGAFAMRRVK